MGNAATLPFPATLILSRSEAIQVESAAMASQKYREWITSNGFGNRDLEYGSGFLLNDAHTKIGKVSFNGRVWDANGKEISR